MRKKKQGVLKINGHEFDARSGEPLNRANAELEAADPAEEQTPARAVKTRSQNNISLRPDKAKTLVRHSVSKPTKSPRKIISISSPAKLSPKSSQITHPVVAGNIDPSLIKRARTFTKSEQISHFGASLKESIATVPNTPTVNDELSKVLPDKSSDNQKATAKSSTDKLLEMAIANAKSHEQPRLSKREIRSQAWRGRHRRKSAVIATSMLGIAVIGFAIYSNMPNLMVKYASIRAGFSAIAPAYKPAGYSLSSVSYQPGQIVMRYGVATSNAQYYLSERSSNWDNAALVSNILAPTQGESYHELSSNGHTVYLYGYDQASWVSKGVWYQINGNGNLSQGQLVKLISSL